MIWAILAVGVAAFVPGFGVQVSSSMVNQGIDALTPYVVNAINGYRVPYIEDKVKLGLTSLDAKFYNLTISNIVIDLNQTNVAFVEPNAVKITVTGVGLKLNCDYDIQYGPIRYTGSNANVTDTGASLQMTLNFTANADNKPQFLVKAVQLNLGSIYVQTGKWYNGSVNAFIKVNKGTFQNIFEDLIKSEVSVLDTTLAALGWQLAVPKTDIKIDLRYYGAPTVLNSQVLYLPFNGTIFSA
jgi:hypothetical protein